MITVYTLDNCPYCDMAKELLTKRGIKFNAIQVLRSQPEKMAEIKAKTGMRTFPQILKGEELIGGYSDLAKVDEKDQLESLK